MVGTLEIRAVPGKISMDRSTSLSGGRLCSSLGNTFGNSFITGISSIFT